MKVFISYSRADMAFADELVAGLEYDGGFEVMIDRHAIHEGEAWKARLGALIAGSDTVVFILSPASAGSRVCAWEVEEAARLRKRIIPVLAERLGDISPPQPLGELNYVRFDPQDDGRPRSFMVQLTALRRTLNTDIGWLREHTRLLERALEWDRAGRQPNRMLSGSDIVSAKHWLEAKPKEAPEPLELHRDFIMASSEAEVARLSAERARAERLQRAVMWMRWALAGAVAFAVVAAGAGWWARLKRLEAVAAEQKAVEAQQKAQAAEERTKKILARVLVNAPVQWSKNDGASPDYRHLAVTRLGAALRFSEFELEPAAIELLLQTNAFEPVGHDGKFVIALRGASLAAGEEGTFAPVLRVKDVRPDHKTFKSLIVIYDKPKGVLAGFAASTVANETFVTQYFMGTFTGRMQAGFLTPTGSYHYIVGPHNERMPSLLMRESMNKRVVVAIRRSANNRMYDLDDVWDVAQPGGNLHASFYADPTRFSSAGSLTIAGQHAKGGAPTGKWARFWTLMGLVKSGTRVDIVLLTGLDAAVATALGTGGAGASPEDRTRHLVRLRQGSRGPAVSRLRAALGMPEGNVLDATAAVALAKRQMQMLGWSDGIYSMEMEDALRMCVLTETHCAPK